MKVSAWRKILYVVILFHLLGVFALSSVSPANALGINVTNVPADNKADLNAKNIFYNDKGQFSLSEASKKLFQQVLPSVGAKVFGSILRTATREIALNAANDLAYGNKGQKSKFFTQGWGPYLNKVVDNAAGNFIEDVTSQFVKDATNGAVDNFSFCSPGNMSIAIKIGLGLRQYQVGNTAKDCSFTKIRSNINAFAKSSNLSSVFQDMFDPTSNDIGLSLSVQSKVWQVGYDTEQAATKQRNEDKGWLRAENFIGDGEAIAGFTPKTAADRQKEYDNKFANSSYSVGQDERDSDASDAKMNAEADAFEASYNKWADAVGGTSDLTAEQMKGLQKLAWDDVNTSGVGQAAYDKVFKGPPGEEERNAQSAWSIAGDQMLTTVGDSLVDAANVFLNQIALKSFKNMMAELSSKSSDSTGISGYGGDYGIGALVNQDAGPINSGIEGAKQDDKKLVSAIFNDKVDYDVLAQLSICEDPENAKVDECVLDENFRDAIAGGYTVGESLKKNYLKGNGIFGFSASVGTVGSTTNGLEPSYKFNFPYRSMVILRKYRVLPVGWEVAAQKIRNNDLDVGINKTSFTLKELVDCFDSDDEYSGSAGDNMIWCRGLVDPNWVLKLPKQYCKKIGPGGAPLSKRATGESYSITRNENYCADEQSCIVENNDGSCGAFGYCTEERRVYRYGTDACEPINNSCTTYQNSKTKSSVSYLSNSITKGVCNLSNAGCKSYCQEYNFASQSWNCTTTPNVIAFNGVSNASDRLYFDYDAKTCTQDDEGCRQLIRTKEGLGANLLVNPSFEDGDHTLANTPSSFVPNMSGFAASVTPAGVVDGFYSTSSITLMQKTVANPVATATVLFGMQPFGWTFNLSFESKDCSDLDTFSFDGSNIPTYKFTPSAGAWSHNEGNATIDFYPAMYPGSSFYPVKLLFSISSPSCKIDNVKLERGLASTGYTDYAKASNATVMQKVIPEYLNKSGLCNNPANVDLCNKYARKCTADQVGCDMYVSQTEDDKQVPGRIKSGDLCKADCVGLNDYMQRESWFDEGGMQFFIPKTAKKCKPESVGCDQFTNVDKVGQGGESTEYYTYLRQCIKPSVAPAGRCNSFYTWQSAAGQAFQLSVVNLYAKDLAGDEPAITSDDILQCNETIYNLDPVDPKANPDCRQFYDKNGKVTYHLLDKTISCDDNCHPYRLTRLNVSQVYKTQASCELVTNTFGARSAFWNSAGSKCEICANNGEMVNATDAVAEHYCVYQAIPDQGVKCSEQDNGCREYVGSRGENIAQLSFDDFETAALDGWQALGVGTNITQDLALRKDGFSIKVDGGAFAVGKKVGAMLTPGKTYALTFLANTLSIGSTLSVNLNKDSNPPATGIILNAIANVAMGNWQTYTVNFTASSTYEFTGDEMLVFNGPDAFNLDEVKIKEITDRFFFVKESWNTPELCYYNMDGVAPPPDPLTIGMPYMLHCDRYKNRDNQDNFLRSFDSLCPNSAVGCELMLDTFNSATPYQTVSSEVGTTSADAYDYVVYDKTKTCSVDNKGCQRLGKMYEYGTSTVSRDVYVKNNPDYHDTIMCSADAVDCEQFSFGTGKDAVKDWFKDPGDNVCESRTEKNSTKAGWFKKKINRCGGKFDNPVCLADSDCAGQLVVADKSCILEDVDHPCSTTDRKTVGLGGFGGRVNQPDVNVGLCAADQNTCTEIIDPLGKANVNLIYNPNLSQDADGNALADGWERSVPAIKQAISLEPNTLYSIGGKAGTAENISLSFAGCGQSAYFKNLDATSRSINSLTLKNDHQRSYDFFTENKETSCVLVVTRLSGTAVALNDADLFLRKAVVDYQFSDKLDKKTCANIVNFSDGCVLFNVRNLSTSLGFDSDLSDANMSAAQSATDNKVEPAENDANVVLKVKPDHVCDKWLACESWSEIKNAKNQDQVVCTSLGLCNRLSSEGRCSNFILEKKKEQVYWPGTNPGVYANFSGYNKVGDKNNGDYPLSAMTQTGGVVTIKNGTFETAGDNGYPNGWTVINNTDIANIDAPGVQWTQNMARIIIKPSDLQKEGLGYTPESDGVLAAGPGHAIRSRGLIKQDATSGSYRLSASVNTSKVKGGDIIFDVVRRDGVTLPLRVMKFPYGQDWKTQISADFDVNDGDVIVIHADNTSTDINGSYYIDDIKVSPVLNIKNDTLTSQSCRLFPESDSRSCNYTDFNSGTIRHGWSGYCLEWDRYPGDANSCLLWWPVDKVQGDNFSELEGYNGGYNGKFPAYYCGQMDGNFRFVEKRQASEFYSKGESKSCFLGDVLNGLAVVAAVALVVVAGIFTGGAAWALAGVVGVGAIGLGASFATVGLDWIGYGDSWSSAAGQCPAGSGYVVQHWLQNCSCDWDDTSCSKTHHYYCVPSSAKYNVVGDANNEWAMGGAWYEYNGSLMNYKNSAGVKNTAETTGGVKILDMNQCTKDAAGNCTGADDGKVVDPDKYNFLACKKFYEVVTSDGQNRAWAARVSPDSVYKMPGLGYSIDEDDSPFGSMFPPNPLDNPYSWDGNSSVSLNQPLSFWWGDNNVARVSSPYSCTGGKCSRIGRCYKTGKACITGYCNNDNTCARTAIGNKEVEGPAMVPHACYAGYGAKMEDVKINSWHYYTDASKSTTCTPVDCTGDGGIYVSGDGTTLGDVECGKTAGGVVTSNHAGCISAVANCNDGCTKGIKSLALPTDTVTTCITTASAAAAMHDFCEPDATTNACPANCQNATILVSSLNQVEVYGSDGTPSVSCQETFLVHDDDTTNDSVDIKDWHDNIYDCGMQDICVPQKSNAEIAKDVTPANARNLLMRTFAQSFGAYIWQPDGVNPSSGHYVPSNLTGDIWIPPVNKCESVVGANDNKRPVNPTNFAHANWGRDYCYVAPKIINVKSNGDGAGSPIVTTLTGSGVVGVSFNTVVDPEQIPMTSYRVIRGDGTSDMMVSGALLDRPNPSNPHLVYLSYNYWKLWQQFNINPHPATLSCDATLKQCTVLISIGLTDNWGKQDTVANVIKVVVNAPI